MTHKSRSGTGRFCPESGVIIIPTPPTQPSSKIMAVGKLEPMEAEPVEADPVAEEAGEAVSAASAGTAATAALSDREGQRLVSTQTVQHDYLTLNGQVARETITVDGTVTTVMDFIYDESGRPFALNYSVNGGSSFTTYYYVLNLQGDVIYLVDPNGNFYAEYTYDAWGNITFLDGELAEINPLRYRGYYYDSETGFYYLQSRYYDPANRRFINADGYASTGQGFLGCNMFAYCNNNPVIASDATGERCIDAISGILQQVWEEINTYIGGIYQRGGRWIAYWGDECPQSYAGFCDLYEEGGAAIGFRIDANPIYFAYGGCEWRLEFWKGSYAKNIMYGGEIGLYYNDASMEDNGWYACATDSPLTMTFDLVDSDGCVVLATRTRTTWWQNGFTNGSYSAGDLTLRAVFYVQPGQEGFYNAFLGAVHDASNTTCTYNDGSIIIIEWR